jgi:hypothetical protein
MELQSMGNVGRNLDEANFIDGPALIDHYL